MFQYFSTEILKSIQLKGLNIIKYNENIKKRINININDYKEYQEKYSSIEIEINPVNNEFGDFINIKKEKEIFYHIYFNNNEKEIKRGDINKNKNDKNNNILSSYII